MSALRTSGWSALCQQQTFANYCLLDAEQRGWHSYTVV